MRADWPKVAPVTTIDGALVSACRRTVPPPYSDDLIDPSGQEATHTLLPARSARIQLLGASLSSTI